MATGQVSSPSSTSPRSTGWCRSPGLSEEEALRVLERRTYRAKVDEDWDRSAQFGVTGVPTFVFGNRGVVGAQPYEALEELVVRGGGQRRT